MRQRAVYHFRITASKGNLSCDSPDHTITTGSLFNGLPVIDVAEHSSAVAPFGGFLIAGQFVPLGDSMIIPAYIADAEGQMVWAYGSEHDVTGVAMSYDGKAIWLSSVNYPDSGASVQRYCPTRPLRSMPKARTVATTSRNSPLPPARSGGSPMPARLKVVALVFAT
jgi:hypothetical protein